ncbi:MAG: hypothetical protein HY530_02525 [Chloroflexi bacterium]|nr:hypothetical protein [Chloroflexota bacterium]
MSGPNKSLALAVSLIAVVLVAGCSSRFVPQQRGDTPPPAVALSGDFPAPTNGRVQSSDEGAVTIDIEWAGNDVQDDSLAFAVAMNTHSVDLDSYDLGKLAVLRDGTGQDYRPISWKSAPGGHHREGTLAFPLPESFSQGKPEYVDIVIRDVGAKERVFRWELS